MSPKDRAWSPPATKIPSEAEASEHLGRRKAVTVARSSARHPAVGRDVRAIRQAADPVAAYKFRVGQTVTLVPNRYGIDRHGRFEVIRLLPAEHGINHYRLKSVSDGHERIATEDELA